MFDWFMYINISVFPVIVDIVIAIANPKYIINSPSSSPYAIPPILFIPSIIGKLAIMFAILLTLVNAIFISMNKNISVIVFVTVIDKFVATTCARLLLAVSVTSDIVSPI